MSERPPATEAKHGVWREPSPDGFFETEHRVQKVGHACGWEQIVWPDEADDVYLAHVTGCRFVRAWRFLMSGVRPPLSMNDRMHWAKKSKLTKSIREEAFWRAKSSKIPALEKCRVQVTWVVPTAHRRDEDNPAPSAKAVYDGLVDAGVVPDDTPEYMEKPTVKIEHQPGQRMWFVTVYELLPEGT